jgi:hypothetical protein
VRLADGRLVAGELAPERHRALQIGLLHARTGGLVELAAGSRRAGRLHVTTRKRADHFLPGGRQGESGWLESVLALAASHADRGEEVFLAPAARSRPRGDKRAVTTAGCLWVDVDQPDQLPALWELLAERPCHLLIETAGTGGVHAYWALARPLPAAYVNPRTGEVVEPIERANLRLIHHLGVDADGRPNVADPACAERSRVMRLAGTVNGKSGRYARIVHADLQMTPYEPKALVGDLADPPAAIAHVHARIPRAAQDRDRYKRIPPPAYFEALAGISVSPRGGLVRCPAPWHTDKAPSCSVSPDPERGWCCHSGNCGARGTIYDLASVLLGGPWGRELRGEQFTNARSYIADVFGGARVGR